MVREAPARGFRRSPFGLATRIALTWSFSVESACRKEGVPYRRGVSSGNAAKSMGVNCRFFGPPVIATGTTCTGSCTGCTGAGCATGSTGAAATRAGSCLAVCCPCSPSGSNAMKKPVWTICAH
ncbi:hypothetical protein D9M68_858140 [compost metagenome]